MHGGQGARVIDRANAVRLTPALLKQVVRELDALPFCQKDDSNARGMAMLRLLEDEVPEIVTPWDRAAFLMVLDFRMSALEQLCEQPEWRTWLRRCWRSALSVYMHDAMVEAAATERLIEQNGRATFEPGRFFRTMLRFCEAEGRA